MDKPATFPLLSIHWDQNGPIINLDAGRFLFQQIIPKMYITVEPL